jgi:hypothetical protein
LIPGNHLPHSLNRGRMREVSHHGQVLRPYSDLSPLLLLLSALHFFVHDLRDSANGLLLGDRLRRRGDSLPGPGVVRISESAPEPVELPELAKAHLCGHVGARSLLVDRRFACG